MRKLFQHFSEYLEKHIHKVFGVMLVLVVIDRLHAYFRFARIYTDSDQTILWLVAKDILNGHFYGPCFYGQSYNPIIESVLALPLLLLHLSFADALPLITIGLSVFPLIMVSVYLFKKIDPWLGLLPLLVSLALSVEYQMLTSISRGFVTGVACWVPGFLLLYFHRTTGAKFLGGFLIGFALYANMNCVLLFPLLLLLPSYQKNESKKWFWMILGFFIGLSSIALNFIYYQRHPELVIHDSPSLKLSTDSFLLVMSKLDNYFDFVTPLLWRAGWVSLFFIVFVSWNLWKYRLKKHFFILICLFFGIIVSFFSSKVNDGTNSVFFSGARMYLAYPFILVYALICLSMLPFKMDKIKVYSASILLCSLLVIIKWFAFNRLVQHALRGSAYALVKVMPVQDLQSKCKELLQFGDDKIELVLSKSGSTADQPLIYGCPCLLDSFTKTFKPQYERRRWLYNETMNSSPQRILITEADTAVHQALLNTDCKILKTDWNEKWILIESKYPLERMLSILK